MRKLLLLAVIILPCYFLHAQKLGAQKTPKRKTCYTATYLELLQKKNPNIERTSDFEAWMGAKIRQKRANPVLNDVIKYTPLPIIFHVMHSGQAVGVGYNVSQALIQAQVRQINKDFANLSGSPYAVSASSGLQFCLAARAPDGTLLTEPGIDRINVIGNTYGKPPFTADAFDNKVKPATFWDPSKYINIWVTAFTIDEGILGYATFPASSSLNGLDESETNKSAGVVIDYQTVGSVGFPSSICGSSNPYSTGETLSHELGHYFGLRHIWGDATCATDYCDDTPQHTEANFGLPAHPKPNSCGTADEMFENFMDYTDDKLLNTFTLNQVERMQIVMLNSTRRKTLPASDAGCANTASDGSKIGFIPCDGKILVPEKSMRLTCPFYTDINLYLNIEDKSTGAATLQVSTSGTATKGLDYELLTPSLAIVAGESIKIIKLRIFDDAAKEADETVQVSYTISGNGVERSATLPQTITVTIQDDDAIMVSQTTKVLLNENFGTTGNTLPAGWFFQAIPGFSSPKNRWVVGANAGADFTGQAMYVSRSFATKKLEYDTTTASAHLARSPLINPGLAGSINVSFKYKVAGETDNDGTYDFGLVQTSLQDAPLQLTTVPGTGPLIGTYNGVTTDSVLKTVNATLPSNLKSQPFYLNFYWENDDNTGSQPPLVIDDVLITSKGIPVESQVNNSRETMIMEADSNFILSKEDNEIIAAISKSSSAINCVNASIQQAGNGQVNVTTSTGIFKRSEKVIKISTAVSTNVTSDVTLYFTTAELAAWPGINDLKVMKVQDGIALNAVLTLANSVILTPVVRDFRQSDGYASFTVSVTGFSQFFLVSNNTTLPLQLLTFNAAALNGVASLTWATGNEFSNKGFNVERSLDGTNFTALSFVAGKNQGAIAGNFNYAYSDKTITNGITYFYRLQQVDLNGKTAYSAVRSVKLNGNGSFLLAYPNPTKNMTHVVVGRAMTASVSLTTSKGEIVWRMAKKLIIGNGFDVPMQQLPPGVYMLWIQDDKGRQNVKIIKE